MDIYFLANSVYCSHLGSVCSGPKSRRRFFERGKLRSCRHCASMRMRDESEIPGCKYDWKNRMMSDFAMYMNSPISRIVNPYQRTSPVALPKSKAPGAPEDAFSQTTITRPLCGYSTTIVSAAVGSFETLRLHTGQAALCETSTWRRHLFIS